MPWVPRIIVITAPYSPERMFNLKNEGDIQQLIRRITRVFEFTDEQDSWRSILREADSICAISQPLDMSTVQETNDKGSQLRVVPSQEQTPSSPVIVIEDSLSTTESMSQEEEKEEESVDLFTL